MKSEPIRRSCLAAMLMASVLATGCSRESEEVKGLRELSKQQAHAAAHPELAEKKRADEAAADPANSPECRQQNQAFMKREITQEQMTAACRKAYGLGVGAPGGS